MASSSTTLSLPEAFVSELHSATVRDVWTRRAPSATATTLVLLASDLAALGFVAAALLLTMSGIPSTEEMDVRQWLILWMPLPLVLVAFACAGLYAQRVRHPAEELRLMGLVIATVFPTFMLTAIVAERMDVGSGLHVLVSWLFTLLILPAARAVVRVSFAHARWWGVPTAVLVHGDHAERVIEALRRWPEMGITPVAVLTDKPGPREVLGVPVLGSWDRAPNLAMSKRAVHALVVARGIPHRRLANTITRYGKFYRRIFVLPDFFESGALWTTATDGVAGYGLWHPALRRFGWLAKRVWDVVQSVLGLTVLFPLLLLIAVMIKFDSKGPVLFRQLRMGKGGRCFYLIKFRTMHLRSEERLKRLLTDDAERRLEYERFHKLREDPRVTRMGRFLRVTCMDELPQLFNVLKGDMSLVGPRAYMPQEISKMDSLERVILQQRPGLTGLWQVSGRNDLSFDERLTLDVHYVHNWTPWLDLYITARTIPVVLLQEGSAD